MKIFQIKVDKPSRHVYIIDVASFFTVMVGFITRLWRCTMKTETLRRNKADIVNRYKRSESLSSIGRHFNCSGALVCKFLKEECGVSVRKQNSLKDYQEKIKEMMDSGCNTEDIVKETGLPATTCRRYIKQLGYDISYKKAGSFKLEKHYDEIIRLYNEEGKGCTQISKIIGCSEPAVSAILRRHGHKGDKYLIKRNVNHDFLDTIDTEEKAYFVGYFMGDGCNMKTRWEISSIDYDILCKIKKSIGFDGDIKECDDINIRKNTKWRTKYKITIGSSKMCDRLKEISCFPRKSCLLESSNVRLKNVKNNIPTTLMRHFFRGWLESDGTIYTLQKGKRTYAAFCGSENIINDCYNYLSNLKMNGIVCKPYRKDYYIYQLRFSKIADVYLLLKYLYNDATIYMDRKYDKAMYFLKNLDGREELLKKRLEQKKHIS